MKLTPYLLRTIGDSKTDFLRNTARRNRDKL